MSRLIRAYQRLAIRDARMAYAFAVLCVAVALALRLPLAFVDAELVPFSTLFPAVLLAAVLGGEFAGLLALVLALLSAWYFILPPAFSFALERRSDFVNLGLFGLSGALMVLIGGTLRRASDRYSEALARAAAYLRGPTAFCA